MALSFFQTAEPTFLREDGSLVNAAGDPVAPADVKTLALSRAFCRFHNFRAPPGATASQIARAARLAGEAQAPFADTGRLILRASGGAAIWLWDKTKIAEIFGTRAVEAAPESVFAAAGEGWRVTEVLDGYEAQYWRDSALRASTWRRQHFTDDQWRLFVSSVDDAIAPAPASPPIAEKPLFDGASAWRRQQIKPPLTWADAERGAATAAFCAAGVAAFFLGQALRLESEAQAATRQAAEIAEALSADPRARRAESQLTLISRYRNEIETPDVLGAASDAFDVLNRFGLSPDDWGVDEAGLRITVLNADGAPVRDIVAALEATDSLNDVEPIFRGRGQGLEFNAALTAPRP
ncbi:hypothetical protein U91I_01933 [alpha proteobacterium U9-1i]|nr:hypothetical protein U91I_01933 [alpha proteobacterium U9-1i]